MKDNRQDLQYFLFSQYFSDGIRMTLAVIIPAIVFGYFDKLHLGLIMSTGAFCVSLTDSPGPVEHKRNGMLYCILLTFLMSLATGFLNHSDLLMGLLVLLSTFLFTLFTVFGNRAATVGTAVLLVMVLRMDKLDTSAEVLLHSLLILSGGIWYLLIALLFFKIYPYRPAQRLLGNCLHETAQFLRIKSALYDVNTNIDEEYRKLVAQQVVVNQKQDELRELLYKNKELIKEPTDTSRLLMITLGDVIDLYENIMATWYDYKQLRQRFGRTPVLAEVSVIIQQLSDEIDRIGLAIQSNLPYSKQYQLLPALDQLKADIDLMEDPNNSNLVLKKILINIRNLGERTDELQNYFKVGSAKKRALRNDRDYDKFVSHQAINLQILINNLGMSSGVFRHALRMMITCVAGFIIAKLLPNAHHSYWILLTIIVILKPGFSLTKERNLQRLFGTVAGGLIGLLIIYFVQDRTVLIVFIAVFMLFAYTFLRVNYILTVIFMTPYVIILFSLLGMGFVNIVEERLLDTAIASVLAFMGSYFLFPSWESLKLENYMIKMLRANHDYLQQLVAFISGNPPAVLEYKLVRKDLYVSAANLSAAFQRMQSEPKSKQRNSLEVYEFMVLNHILSSNVASLTAAMMHKKSTAYTKEILSPVKKSISILKQSVLALDGEQALKETSTIAASKAAVAEEKTDAQLIEQVHFIYKVTSDIGKVAQKISTTL